MNIKIDTIIINISDLNEQYDFTQSLADIWVVHTYILTFSSTLKTYLFKAV